MNGFLNVIINTFVTILVNLLALMAINWVADIKSKHARKNI